MERFHFLIHLDGEIILTNSSAQIILGTFFTTYKQTSLRKLIHVGWAGWAKVWKGTEHQAQEKWNQPKDEQGAKLHNDRNDCNAPCFLEIGSMEAARVLSRSQQLYWVVRTLGESECFTDNWWILVMVCFLNISIILVGWSCVSNVWSIDCILSMCNREHVNRL